MSFEPSSSLSRRARIQPGPGWRPPTELEPGKYVIGGGVPAGKGVPPAGLYTHDGKLVDELPIEGVKWDRPVGTAGGGKGKEKESTSTSGNSPPQPQVSTGSTLPPAHQDSRTWACREVGACQPCPVDSLHFPYCQPYGNRIPVSCSPVNGVASSSSSSSSSGSTSNSAIDKDSINGWHQCGKVVSQERRDFLEFGLLNAVIVIIGFVLLIRRQRWLSEKQYAVLNQRMNS